MQSNRYESHFINIVKKFVNTLNYKMIGALVHRARIRRELSLMEIIELAEIIESDINKCQKAGGTTIFDRNLYYRQENGVWIKDWSYGGTVDAS